MNYSNSETAYKIANKDEVAKQDAAAFEKVLAQRLVDESAREDAVQALKDEKADLESQKEEDLGDIEATKSSLQYITDETEKDGLYDSIATKKVGIWDLDASITAKQTEIDTLETKHKQERAAIVAGDVTAAKKR